VNKRRKLRDEKIKKMPKQNYAAAADNFAKMCEMIQSQVTKLVSGPADREGCPPAPASSLLAKLQELKHLKDTGVITESEHDLARSRLLGGN
jgi:hypothetical protein